MARRPDSIVLVCAADRQYIRPLGVALGSVVAHLDPCRRLAIHVIARSIPEEHRALVARSVAGDLVTLSWHEPDSSSLLGVPLWGVMPITTYYKLLIAELIPRDIDQVLWLDGDTLVMGDIAPLWDGGTGGHPVMAVQDALVPLVSSRFGVARYRELGLRHDAKYFNAGVMLIDLHRWRRQEVAARALAYLKTYARSVSFWDQEGLNAVLSDEWGELDPVWNWSVTVGQVDMGRTDGCRSMDPAPRAKIVHFTGNLKPWRYHGRHPCYDAYYESVDRTPWRGWRPQPHWYADAFRRCEGAAVRRVLYPVEQLGSRLWMVLTRRCATSEDL